VTAVLGADIGGTAIDVVCIDDRGLLLAHRRAPTPRDGARSITESLVTCLNDVLDAADVPVSAIGVGIPGQVDTEEGTVCMAVNLGIDGRPWPLAGHVARMTGLPVALENDVRAAALGAYHRLTAERIDTGGPFENDLVYLSVGTGISAGYVRRGRIHRGRLGMAGEIGHVIVDPHAGRCNCGLDGCLEIVAAGPAIARLWPTANGRSAQDLFTAAVQGEPRAVFVARPIVDHLTTALQWLVMGYAPDVVVLGGGVGTVPTLVTLLHRRLRELGARSRIIRDLLDPERIVVLSETDYVGAQGAAWLARDSPTSVPSKRNGR
jgi:predicted NBD/HSP70 family sugar kinase